MIELVPPLVQHDVTTGKRLHVDRASVRLSTISYCEWIIISVMRRLYCWADISYLTHFKKRHSGRAKILDTEHVDSSLSRLITPPSCQLEVQVLSWKRSLRNAWSIYLEHWIMRTLVTLWAPFLYLIGLTETSILPGVLVRFTCDPGLYLLIMLDYWLAPSLLVCNTGLSAAISVTSITWANGSILIRSPADPITHAAAAASTAFVSPQSCYTPACHALCPSLTIP